MQTIVCRHFVMMTQCPVPFTCSVRQINSVLLMAIKAQFDRTKVLY